MRLREPLTEWRPLRFEPPDLLVGSHARLERLDVDAHAEALHAANQDDAAMWRFMHDGPFPSFAAYRGWVAAAAESDDPAFYAVAGELGWSGVASLMRIDRDDGVIEIGGIAYSRSLQRTIAGTEAIHLLLACAFEAGFRRVEWKCNALNAGSRRAAERYGFVFEGVFRQHMVVKGANRDTAWFAMLDGDWPRIRQAHRAWLSPENFDETGTQRRSLSELTAG